jgi:hypothetical protein
MLKQVIQEALSRDNRYPMIEPQIKQVAILGHEIVSPGGRSCREELVVLAVSRHVSLVYRVLYLISLLENRQDTGGVKVCKFSELFAQLRSRQDFDDLRTNRRSQYKAVVRECSNTRRPHNPCGLMSARTKMTVSKTTRSLSFMVAADSANCGVNSRVYLSFAVVGCLLSHRFQQVVHLA